MNVDRDTLDLLISRQIDNEITPIEAQLLQEILDNDPEARAYFEQTVQSDQIHRAAFETLMNQGRDAEEIVHAARTKAVKQVRILSIRKWLTSRFTTGVAAGLLMAFSCQLLFFHTNPSVNPDREVASGTVPHVPEPHLDRAFVDSPAPPHGTTTRNVDWYSFTDAQGTHWLVEGLRENKVQPAVYHEDF